MHARIVSLLLGLDKITTPQLALSLSDSAIKSKPVITRWPFHLAMLQMHFSQDRIIWIACPRLASRLERRLETRSALYKCYMLKGLTGHLEMPFEVLQIWCRGVYLHVGCLLEHVC